MEIGNEISQKIRSAIKAKLVELGAYVDDELPDYIMVMVANKKSKAHMTEDLNLFLGNNTDKFTTWLHGLLQKLKSITVEQNKSEDAATESVDTKQNSSIDEGVLDTTEEQIEAVDAAEKEDEPKLTEQEKRKREEEEEVARALEAIEDDGLTLEPETDEFAEEEKLMAAAKQTKPPGKQPPAPKSKPKIVASQAKEAVVKALAEPVKSRSTTRSSAQETKKEHASASKDTADQSASRRVTRSSESASAETISGNRKRKTPGSVVSIIHKRAEEEDEGYDPHKPQYGRVASTVKVGTRRPTVPPSKQANKSLLMKAVSEAKTSIEKTTKKSGVVEPLRRPETKSGVHSRLGSSVASDARSRLGPHRSSTRRRSPERSYSSRSRMRSDEIEKRSLSSRSRRDEIKDRLSSDTRAKKARIESVEAEDKSPVSSEGRGDNRVFETKSDGGSEGGSDVQDSRTVKKQDGDDSLQLELLIQSGAEDSDFTDEDIEPGEDDTGKRVVQEPISEGREKPPSPKFVVSLDGIDPDMIEKFEDRMDEDLEGEELMDVTDEDLSRDAPMDAEEAAMRARNIVKVRPMQVLNRPDAAANRPKLLEKCKFWPACRSGEECPFHHPTTPCKAFPNCKFGEKCNYIHPNCMFDASCTRLNCPYTHATKKKSPPAASPPIILQPVNMVAVPPAPMYPPRPPAPKNSSGKPSCRFYPKCTNMNCPFYHPKMCRFGLSCRSRLTGCPFTHPALPSKDQLKWTAVSRLATSAPESDESLEAIVMGHTELKNHQSDEEDESVNINL